MALLAETLSYSILDADVVEVVIVNEVDIDDIFFSRPLCVARYEKTLLSPPERLRDFRRGCFSNDALVIKLK